jgi:cbb3-type cytochrome oxidase subunit 3
VLEYVTITLGVITGVAGAVAYIYRRGRTDGIDNACELRIKDDIQSVKSEVVNMKSEGIAEHKEIKADIKTLNSKVDEIKGSTDVIKSLFQDHISQKS